MQDLKEIYKLRNSFVVLGLTGRKFSGCSYVAQKLEKGFNPEDYPKAYYPPLNNSQRKYNIVLKYAEKNFKEGFKIIKYTEVLLLFSYLSTNYEFEEFVYGLIDLEDDVKNKLISVKNEIKLPTESFDLYNIEKLKGKEEKLFDLFESSEDFIQFKNEIKKILYSYKLLQSFYSKISNHLREVGKINCPTCGKGINTVHVYVVVELINRIVKGYREKTKKSNTICKVVIDSLRNPLEIMYFKERYSAFYMMSINADIEIIKKKLSDKFNEDQEMIDFVLECDKIEYKGKSDNKFYEQNVSECIQKSDIHINNNNQSSINNDIIDLDEVKIDFNLEQQLIKYLSLISLPGIITPSPIERNMQIAYIAKYNSGCISRQVGAVITDENFSVKAIGWNNTPQGQTPCLLRKVDDLLENNNSGSFSDYEFNNKEFKEKVNIYYSNIDDKYLNGRNLSFCFKCIQNNIKDGKNQVHTRSLHAEESAFLQITKYGGIGIENGILFTTASPCELCSKKAYQLGINKIYYIDPYPGIAVEHIIKSGSSNLKKSIKLFQGVIGTAYHKLYSPFMAYKDELSILTGLEIVDYATEKIKEKDTALNNANYRIKELEEIIRKLKKINF